MTDLLWIAVALVGYWFTYWLLYPVMADHVLEVDNPTDRGLAVMLTMLCCIFWPLVLIGAVVFRHSKPAAREREQALIAREARIAQLERELGIGRKDS